MTEKILVDVRNINFGFPYLINSDFKTGFGQAGYETYNNLSESDEQALQIDRADGVRFRICMNNSLDSIGKTARLKTVSWLQDNHFQVAHRVECEDPRQFFLCADRDQVDEVPYYLGAVNEAAHLPHWATEFGPLPHNREFIESTFDDRGCDLVFVGSCDGALWNKAINDLNRLKPEYQALAKGVIDTVRSGDARSIGKIADSVDESLGLSLKQEDKRAFCSILTLADDFIRLDNRVRLFKALSGIRIMVVSPHAQEIAKIAGDGIHPFGPDQGSDDIVSGLFAMCQSKLMINNLPNYRGGVTERFFNAQLRGCAVFSERNAFLEEEFEEEREVFLYDPYDLTDVKDRVLEILKNREKLKEVALAGYDKTRANHLVANRVKRILELH